jgi:apolipoprotein N-acyltransferase
MSEESLQISSDAEEDQAIALAQSILAANTTVTDTFIGISYLKMLPHQSLGTNHFALVSKDSILWNYVKAHPVPLVEANVQPGPAILPIKESVYGRLGGAICFDLDFPSYIWQAGIGKVDILLQPSWTWNAINYRHFNGNALRAIENGFTLFRCSSVGESGVVGPRGLVAQRQFTSNNPSISASFFIPLNKRVDTFYVYGGFVFEWICLAATVIFAVFAFFPEEYLDIRKKR